MISRSLFRSTFGFRARSAPDNGFKRFMALNQVYANSRVQLLKGGFGAVELDFLEWSSFKYLEVRKKFVHMKILCGVHHLIVGLNNLKT